MNNINKEIIIACTIGNKQLLINLARNIKEIRDISDERGRNLLIIAVYHHHYEIVRYLLIEKKFDINSVNINGTSVLMYAKTKVIDNNNYQFLTFLIENGANIYHKDNFDKDIFYYLDKIGHKGLINFFNKYR